MKAMRFAARTVLTLLLAVCCREVAAADSNSSWWPFGHQDSATLTQPQAVAPGAAPIPALPPNAQGPVKHEVMMPQSSSGSTTAQKDSSWFHLPHLPSLSSSSTAKTDKKAPSARNSWATKGQPPKPASPSPLQSVKNGAHTVAEGTKSAYHKTIAALTPGSKTKTPNKSQVTKSDSPSLMQRMFGSKPAPPEPKPTVPGFLAQKRLDP